jgi:hypothetical protein
MRKTAKAVGLALTVFFTDDRGNEHSIASVVSPGAATSAASAGDAVAAGL